MAELPRGKRLVDWNAAEGYGVDSSARVAAAAERVVNLVNFGRDVLLMAVTVILHAPPSGAVSQLGA